MTETTSSGTAASVTCKMRRYTCDGDVGSRSNSGRFQRLFVLTSRTHAHGEQRHGGWWPWECVDPEFEAPSQVANEYSAIMSRRSSRALAARSCAPGFRPVISGTQFAEHVLLNFAGRAHGQVLDEDDADGHAPLGAASAIEGENLTFMGRAKSTGFSEARRRRRPSRRPQTETAMRGQRPRGSSHRPTSRAMNGHWGDTEGPAHSYAAEEFMQ